MLTLIPSANLIPICCRINLSWASRRSTSFDISYHAYHSVCISVYVLVCIFSLPILLFVLVLYAQLTLLICTNTIGERNDKPLQHSCLENSMNSEKAKMYDTER